MPGDAPEDVGPSPVRESISPLTNMAPRSRLFKFAAGFVGGTVVEVVIVAAGWFWCTKDTHFAPFTQFQFSRRPKVESKRQSCLYRSCSPHRTTFEAQNNRPGAINAQILPGNMVWPRVCSSEDILRAQM